MPILTRRQVLVGGSLMAAGLMDLPDTSDLLDLLDLDRPELRAVREAVQSGDRAAALRHFAAHLRTRKTPRWFIDPDNPPPDPTPAVREWADLALEHEFISVGIRHKFEGKIDWSFNPTTQPGSPHAVNHEWTWQLNRHGAWRMMARTFNTTGDPKYARELSRQLLEWIQDNPPPVGRADQAPRSRWRTIEAGLRMANGWAEIYHRLIRYPYVFPDEVLLPMVRCIAQHAAYLEAFPTSGNWLCMESNGLYHVGALFPEFKDAERWRNVALERLRKELDVQVYPDGAQFELTPGYHNVSRDNFVVAFKLARLNNYPVPDGYLERLERMYDYYLKLMAPDRDVPPFNDSWSMPVRDVLAEGYELFPKRKDWQWVATDGKHGRRPTFTSVVFPYAGWTVMRSGWQRDALYLNMDAGPFGYGHQHEDKLSFVLHAYGQQLVFDAGSYAYENSPMRHYVVSARGHNVVHVDGLEQHRRGKSRELYVVKEPVPLTWQTSRQYDYAEASYGTQPDEAWGPQQKRHVVHTRRVLFIKPLYWVICDTLTPSDEEEHLYESTFHLDVTTAEVDPATLAVTAYNENVGLRIIPLRTPGLDARIIQGQMEPFVQGWKPIQHGRTGANPTPCVYYSQRKAGETHFLYVFAPFPEGRVCPVSSVDIATMPDAKLAATIRLSGGRALQMSLTRDNVVRLHLSGGRVLHFGR